MALPATVHGLANLRRAFNRIVRGSNSNYKHYFRHLYPSYDQGLEDNLADLSFRLHAGTYSPSQPRLVYQPKKSGILRPLTLLNLEDQIVYQALVNLIANRMAPEQAKLAMRRRYGAIYAGSSSDFFFRSWKTSYRAYVREIEAAFNAGKEWVADFDLVSCYELIDHNLLSSCISKQLKSQDTLDLLLRCLAAWTTNSSGSHLRHGLPQGPEASAFLAECLLFRFDHAITKDVTYVRYIDDIRLLAKGDIALRRALLKLDLLSKDTGLVPQAQKIDLRKASSADEIIRTLPSTIASAAIPPVVAQVDLQRMFRGSIVKRQGRWQVTNPTHFRYALYRLNPRRDILERCGSLLVSRPDLAPAMANYLTKFPRDKRAADLLLDALRLDPTYDAAAAAYIEAMDVCEPVLKTTAYRRVIQTAERRSEEKSITVKIATSVFRAKRRGATDALRLIEAEADPLVRSIAYGRLFGSDPAAPFKLSQASASLTRETRGADGDLARFAASLLIDDAAERGLKWKAPIKCHETVVRLQQALGLRKRGPKTVTVVETFLARYGVISTMPWRKACGPDFSDIERRCLRAQRLSVNDPTAYILMIDTLNEALLQRFSKQHPSLRIIFAAAAGTNTHPNMGNWVRNGSVGMALPVASKWFLSIHEARVGADLAHAKAIKGSVRGKPTRAITHQLSNRLMTSAKPAWAELIRQWRTFL